MAVLRTHAWIERGYRQDRETDAATGQEATKAGRRPVRGVHGLCIPSGRPVGGESVQVAAKGAPVEAGAGAGIEVGVVCILVVVVNKVMHLVSNPRISYAEVKA